jgi:hypothetical protein
VCGAEKGSAGEAGGARGTEEGAVCAYLDT